MTARLRLALALGLVVAGPAAAHRVSPEAVVAELNGTAGRTLGVERASRDDKAPRLLVIRVGETWYRLTAERRRAAAAGWLRSWRESVAGGIVAVLDAGTDRPVVHFAPGGRVSAVSGPPAAR